MCGEINSFMALGIKIRRNVIEAFFVLMIYLIASGMVEYQPTYMKQIRIIDFLSLSLMLV